MVERPSGLRQPVTRASGHDRLRRNLTMSSQGPIFSNFSTVTRSLRQHVLSFVTNAPMPLADVHARDSFLPPEGCSPSSRSPLIASLFDPRHPRLELPTPRRADSRHPRRSPFVVSSSSRRIVARFRRPRPVPRVPSGFARPPLPSPRCPPSAPPRFSSPRSTPCAEGRSSGSPPSPN